MSYSHRSRRLGKKHPRSFSNRNLNFPQGEMPTMTSLWNWESLNNCFVSSQIMMGSMLTYSLTITCVKISLLVLYRRIFNTPAFRTRSLLVGVACLAWWIVEVFTNIFQCRPIAAAFDPASLFTNRCNDLQSYYTGITASNLGLDIILLLLPLHMVWKLQLPIKQRLALIGIFSLGFL